MPAEKLRDKHDRALEDSFPASDPPANSGIVGPGAPDDAAGEALPKGTPTHERFESETAHHAVDKKDAVKQRR